jgi:hypothetical protein
MRQIVSKVAEVNNWPLAERFVGSWKLMSYEARGDDGHRVTYPLSDDAKGYILDTAGGYMSAQIMQVTSYAKQSSRASSCPQRALSLWQRTADRGAGAGASLTAGTGGRCAQCAPETGTVHRRMRMSIERCTVMV